MTAEPSNDGLDELMRLSQQFKKQERQIAEREKLIATEKEKSQGVLSELRAFTITTALGQLRLVAAPDIVERVSTFRSKQGTAELSSLINNLANDLEKRIIIAASANPELKVAEQSVRTLTILLGLLASLSN